MWPRRITSTASTSGLRRPLSRLMKQLIKARILDGAANYLSSDFRDASFAFHSTSMTGVTEQKPLWETAVARVNGTLGDVVGQKYVAKHFPAEAKERMIRLVDNLKVALGNRIDNLTWMSNETKVKAHDKLKTFIVKVGYPDKWWTYEDLKLNESLTLRVYESHLYLPSQSQLRGPRPACRLR